MRSSDSLYSRVRRRLASSHYLRDVLLQASGSSAAQLLGIAVMPLLTRLYAPSDFSVLNLLTQLVSGLAVLLTMRFEYMVMLPSEQSESDSILRLTFFLGLVHVAWLTPLLWFLSGEWVWLRSQGGIANWLWIAPISAFATSLAVGLQQMVQRRGDFSSSAISEFVGRGAYVACTVVGALALPSIVGLMASTLVNGGAKVLWLMRSVGGNVRYWLLPNRVGVSKYICRMALSTSVSNLISIISGMAPMVFIADQYGANALGQYGLVVSTLYLPSVLLGQAIGQVYYQRACRLHGDGRPFAELVVATSRNLVKLGVPLYALIALLAPQCYPLVFGSEWDRAGELARWLSVAAVAGFLSTPLDRTSIIVGAWWYLSTWHALRAVLTVSCLFASLVFDLSFESCVLVLSLQNAVAYGIDWIASWFFANNVSALDREVDRDKGE